MTTVCVQNHVCQRVEFLVDVKGSYNLGKYLLVLAQRQNIPFILQQDQTLPTNPSQQLGGLGCVLRPLLLALLDPARRACLDKVEHLPRTRIQLVLEDLVRLDRELERLAAEAGRAGHLQVQPGQGGLDRRVAAVPVAHDQALPPPLLAQQLVQQPLVVAAKGAVDAVVARHEAARPAVPHGQLERLEINLAQGAVGDDGVGGVALVLLVVAHKVLDGGLDAGGLDAVDQGGRAQPREHGVLAQGLEATAAQGRALHVDGGAQDDVGALGLGLVAHLGACFAQQGQVEGGAQGGPAWEAGGFGAVKELGSSHAVGAVRETQ